MRVGQGLWSISVQTGYLPSGSWRLPLKACRFPSPRGLELSVHKAEELWRVPPTLLSVASPDSPGYPLTSSPAVCLERLSKHTLGKQGASRSQISRR